jgi:predicted GIY-YIG superfamily endonuclease
MLTVGMKNYWVYILASRPRGTLCVGMTNDLVRRVYQHREGVVEGFTSAHGVKLLVYYEQQPRHWPPFNAKRTSNVGRVRGRSS